MPKPKKIIFVKSTPAVSVEEGMFHIRFDHIAELAMSPHRFRLTAAAFKRAVEQWDIAQREQSVALLEPVRRRRKSDREGG